MEVLTLVLVFMTALFRPNSAQLVACKDGQVRLVDDGPDRFLINGALSRGRAEICIDETFQTICEDSWTNREASLLCSELGFSSQGAIGLGNALFRGNSVPSAEMLTCSGNESRLAQCSSSRITDNQCETASAVCQNRSTVFASCYDGDVRLRGGSNHLEGRVEICINNAWGTICKTEFTLDEARIVCDNLGFNEGVLVGSPETVLNGMGNGPIFLDKLRCDSTHQDLLACPSGEPHGLATCSHSDDVGVRCPDRNECFDVPPPCHIDAICTDTVGGFLCECKPGYAGDGTTDCTDIDECAGNNGGCEDRCTNTPGGFNCSCATTGYRLGQDNSSCIGMETTTEAPITTEPTTTRQPPTMPPPQPACPPLCTPTFCSARQTRRSLCTIPSPGRSKCDAECRITFCHTCYFADEDRPLPGDCDTCSFYPLSQADEKCFKRWAVCVRRANGALYPKARGPREKKQERFRCYEHPCL